MTEPAGTVNETSSSTGSASSLYRKVTFSKRTSPVGRNSVIGVGDGTISGTASSTSLTRSADASARVKRTMTIETIISAKSVWTM